MFDFYAGLDRFLFVSLFDMKSHHDYIFASSALHVFTVCTVITTKERAQTLWRAQIVEGIPVSSQLSCHHIPFGPYVNVIYVDKDVESSAWHAESGGWLKIGIFIM